MNPQEREMIATLVERLKRAQGQPKDLEAEAAIRQVSAAQPDAPYSLVQTALIQELSLQQAQNRIGELERQLAEAKPASSPPPSFLGGAAAGAAAAAAPSAAGSRDTTDGGTGGGGFLRSAATMAAGGAAGALLYQGIGSFFGQSNAGSVVSGEEDSDSVILGDGDSDSVTVVTTRSWGGRVAGSFIGVLFGILFVAISFILLYWNEGRAVDAIAALDQAARQVVEIDAAAIDPNAEGKPVHLTGLMETSAPVRDPILGVGGDRLLRLSRKVEMFQWEEEKTTRSHKSVGGSETTETTYSYRKGWSDHPLDSSRFHEASNHRNPPMPVESTITNADGVRLGAYRVEPGLLQEVTAFTPFEPQTAPSGYQRIGEILYRAREIDNPAVGDLRVSFRAVPAQTMTVVAALTGSDLAPFHGANGYRIALASPGTLTAGEMFREKKHEESILTWVLRGVGFVLMLAGFMLVFGPLAVLAGVLPFLEGLVEAGIFLVALTLAVPLTLITIAAAWFAHRPLIGAALIVAGIAFIFLIRRLPRASRRRPTPVAR
jgi:hypothetical protein